MAKVTVNGTIGKELGQSGVILLEPITLPNGSSFDRKWKVWANTHFAEGTQVIVTGTFSSKINTYEMNGETKHGVDLSLNDVTIDAAGTPSPEAINLESTPF